MDAPPPPETVYVETTTVACDGNGLDHPRVYLNLGPEGAVDCPYCDRRFVLKSGAKVSGSH